MTAARTPDDLMGLLRQVRQRLERLENRRHAPRAMWARLPVPGNGTFTVTFPTDLFDDVPTVLYSLESPEAGARAQLVEVTPTDFKVTVSGATRAGAVHWHALAS